MNALLIKSAHMIIAVYMAFVIRIVVIGIETVYPIVATLDNVNQQLIVGGFVVKIQIA